MPWDIYFNFCQPGNDHSLPLTTMIFFFVEKLCFSTNDVSVYIVKGLSMIAPNCDGSATCQVFVINFE